MDTKKHKLIISSLRDLHAFCTCGKWSVIIPVSEAKSDKDIHQYAKEQHKLHKSEPCQTCGGSGTVTNWENHTVSASAWPPDNEKTCPECTGTGKTP